MLYSTSHVLQFQDSFMHADCIRQAETSCLLMATLANEWGELATNLLTDEPVEVQHFTIVLEEYMEYISN